MGQTQTLQHQPQVTLQQVQQSIHMIFDDKQVKFQSNSISLSISRILQNLSDNIPAQKTQQGFVLNLKMMKIFYHNKFLFTMGKLINLLIQKLQQTMKKSIMMIQKQQWSNCLNLANFILFFSDDKLIRMAQTANIRNDLSEETRVFIEKLQKEGGEFQATQNLIDKFSYSEIQRIEKCLRISMNQMIMMRTQVLTRSERTLKIIEKLEQACFMLYLKALYSPQHSKSIINKAKHPQFLKSNLTIGHYFLGKGSDTGTSSIYQAAVLFLFNLIQKNKLHLRQYKSLPSHLFKKLPIVSQNTIYDFVMNIALFSLTYIKQGTNLFLRFSFNRLMTLKLLDIIVKEGKVTSPQITYYLEQICLQTKIGMIQRSFVTDLVQRYMNVVEQTISQQKKRKQKNLPMSQSKLSAKINPTNNASQLSQNHQISRYSKQTRISQILTKYLQSGKQNYNIKYSNKKFKITTVDVITQLQNDQNQIQTQFRILSQKYIYQIILNKKIVYQYNDRQIWNEILPHILEDKELSGDEIDENQVNQEKNNKYSKMVRENNEKEKQLRKKNETNQYKQTEQRRIFELRTQQNKFTQQDHHADALTNNKVILISQNLNVSNQIIDDNLYSIEQQGKQEHVDQINNNNNRLDKNNDDVNVNVNANNQEDQEQVNKERNLYKQGNNNIKQGTKQNNDQEQIISP